MSIVLRQEIALSITGADKAEKELKAVAGATKEVSEANIRARIAVQDAEQAIIKKVRAEQEAKKAIEDLLEPTKEAEKETSLFGKALEGGGKGMSMLRKAAELIPGLELGTIFAAAAAGVYALYEALQPSTTATQLQTAAFEAQAIAVRDLSAAHRELVKSQIGAGNAALKQAVDRMGSGLSPEAMDKIVQLSAFRDIAVREQADAMQRAVRQSGGAVPITDSEAARIESLRTERNKFIGQAGEKEDGEFKLSFEERESLGIQAKAHQDEIDKIRRDATSLAARDLPRDAIRRATADIEDYDRDLKAFGVGVDAVGKTAAGIKAKDTGTLFNPFALARRGYRGLVPAANQQIENQASEVARIAGQHGAMADMAAGHRAPESAQAEVAKQAAGFGGAMQDIWKTQIPDAVSFGAQAITQAAGVIGSAFTNMIIGGDRMKGGFGKIFGELAAQLSTSLFTYATLALAVGGALVWAPQLGVFLGGLTAPQAFGAAAAFAGGAGALAITARALGAGSSGGAKGASGGGASAAPRGSLAGPGMGGPQSINATINMDGEPVYNGMIQVEQRRRSSGSLTAPMLGAT